MIGPEPDKTYFSQLEYPVIADVGIAGARAGDFAAVLVPGGAPAKLHRRRRAHAGLHSRRGRRGALLAATAEGVEAIAGGEGRRKVTARSTNDLPEFCKALFRALA